MFLECLDAPDPEMGRLCILLCFSALLRRHYDVVRFAGLVLLRTGLTPITVMRFVVQDDDVLASHQVCAALATHSSNHFAPRFGELLLPFQPPKNLPV